MPKADPVQVRLVGNASAQLVGVAAVAALVVGVVVAARWKHYGPYLATRTARKLRAFAARTDAAAQRIEDAGLNIARRDAT